MATHIKKAETNGVNLGTMTLEEIDVLRTNIVAELHSRKARNDSTIQEVNDAAKEANASIGVEPVSAAVTRTTRRAASGSGRRGRRPRGAYTLKTGALHLLGKGSMDKDQLLKAFHDELDYPTTASSLYVSGILPLKADKLIHQEEDGKLVITAKGKTADQKYEKDRQAALASQG